MLRVAIAPAIVATVLADPTAAQAPAVYKLAVNDRAELVGGNVNCAVRGPDLLSCGGKASKVFVQFDRHYVTVFRLRSDSSFRQLYRVSP